MIACTCLGDAVLPVCIMAGMHPQKFEIPVNGANVCGELHLPDSASSEVAVPVVLICRGVGTLDDAAEEFLIQVASGLANSGVAAARFEHRCSSLILDDFDSHTAQHDIEDATAVYDWLVANESVDEQAIGVLGYCMGGIAAVSLAGRCRRAARLCLAAATTAAHLHGCIMKEIGAYGVIRAANLPQQYVPSLEKFESAQDAAAHEGETLLIHAAADRVIPQHVPMELAIALQAAKRRFEHIQIARADHALSAAPARKAAIEHVVRFFAAMIHAEPLAVAGRKSA